MWEDRQILRDRTSLRGYQSWLPQMGVQQQIKLALGWVASPLQPAR